MATIGKSTFCTLPNGREATLFTLKNTKGAAVKVTDLGARLVAWRTMGRGYEYLNLMPEPSQNGAELWTAQEEYEGVRFTQTTDGKKISILYSFSNDNELLIRYAAESDSEILCPTDEVRFMFGGATELTLCSDAQEGDIHIIRDVPPDIEMEPGMFGYDPTCPIDYLDAGLKKAVEAINKENGVQLTAFSNLPCFVLNSSSDGSFGFTATGKETKKSWQAQTVFAVKVR